MFFYCPSFAERNANCNIVHWTDSTSHKVEECVNFAITNGLSKIVQENIAWPTEDGIGLGFFGCPFFSDINLYCELYCVVYTTCGERQNASATVILLVCSNQIEAKLSLSISDLNFGLDSTKQQFSFHLPERSPVNDGGRPFRPPTTPVSVSLVRRVRQVDRLAPLIFWAERLERAFRKDICSISVYWKTF